MYVHESGVGYTLYIQNNKYANQVLEEREAESSGKIIDKPYDKSIVKFNYSMDVEYGDGISRIKNDTFDFDLKAANDVLSKFQDIYASNGELSKGLGQFSEYLNEIYTILKKEANPESNGIKTDIASSSDTKNDLVNILVEEIDKNKAGSTAGTEELQKNLYKKYIKSLSSNLTSGLFQQYG